MGILSLANAQVAKSNAPKGNAAKREASELWLNVGVEVNGKFVTLPFGLALDTMSPLETRGQNVEFVQFQQARNELLEDLKDIASKLAPGEEMEVPVLTIKIRRKNDELELAPENNPFSAGIKSLLGA